jgi:hypothetical protein
MQLVMSGIVRQRQKRRRKKSRLNMKKGFVVGFWCLFLSNCLFAQDRRPSNPYLTGDGFRAIATHLFDETSSAFIPSKVRDGEIIFVKTDYIERFFREVHPRITAKYVLITHNSDDPCPGKCAAYLDDEKLLAWFGQNAEGVIHPKLHPIPIGIENRYNRHGNPALVDGAKKKYTGMAKQHLLYMNFVIGTRPDERSYVYNMFKDQPFCKKAAKLKYDAYLHAIAESQFILSPRGNGLDCHRTWESLYMGAIPVVKSSAMDEVFQDLPVVIVKNWSDVTEEFLKEQWNQMQRKEYNQEKLFMDYWIHLIDSYRHE